MRSLWLGFFFLCFLYYAPVYASTIVNVEEESSFLWREQFSDCEWIDHFEVQTTTTFQEISGGFSPFVPYVEPPKDSTKGFWNPCLPEYADASGNLPAYCPTERLPEPALAPLVLGVALTSAELYDPVIREWSQLELGEETVYHNTCVSTDPGCDHDPIGGGGGPLTTPTPEPGSLVFGITGLMLVALMRYRSRKQ
jgi:hypothetical protein